jgi:rhodanese-related sulfurtransferase
MITIPEPIKAQSSVTDLKQRLDWGEPALTIIDVRSRDAFNVGHIMGAISVPMGKLVEKVQNSLETNRDIYIYGDNEEETATAVSALKDAGYERVAQLLGGLSAWQKSGYPVEG